MLAEAIASAATPWDSIPWSVAAALLGAAANYGALRPAITALKDEVAELKRAAAPITDIDKRLVRAETEIAAIQREVARAHDAIESKHASVGHRIEQLRADVLRLVRSESTDPGGH